VEKNRADHRHLHGQLVSHTDFYDFLQYIEGNVNIKTYERRRYTQDCLPGRGEKPGGPSSGRRKRPPWAVKRRDLDLTGDGS
jgi:hypothetical protein